MDVKTNGRDCDKEGEAATDTTRIYSRQAGSLLNPVTEM